MPIRIQLREPRKRLFLREESLLPPKFNMPWAMIYTDPQGYTRIEHLALLTSDEHEYAMDAGRRRKEAGCKIVFVVNLNQCLFSMAPPD